MNRVDGVTAAVDLATERAHVTAPAHVSASDLRSGDDSRRAEPPVEVRSTTRWRPVSSPSVPVARDRPLLMIVTRSQTCSASARRWVLRKTVVPRSRSSRMISGPGGVGVADVPGEFGELPHRIVAGRRRTIPPGHRDQACLLPGQMTYPPCQPTAAPPPGPVARIRRPHRSAHRRDRLRGSHARLTQAVASSYATH
jgi:hypothetical protein